MLFDRLGVRWTNYWGHITQPRALVVDDEQVIGAVLQELLDDEGFEVDTAPDAEAGWECIQSGSYDLLVADKNLPGMSGLELIARVNEAGIDLPSVMITGFASVASISEALRHGAADYIAKPFPDVRCVVRRLKSVVDWRAADQFYARIARDLAEAVRAGGVDREAAQAISRELSLFKNSLSQRPSVLLVESGDLAEVAAAALATHGLSTEVLQDLGSAMERLCQPTGPLTAVLDLGLHDVQVHDFIATARRRDPLLEFLVTSWNLGQSLNALSAGAADFVNRSEGLDVWQARVLRLVERAGRQRLQVHMLSTLYRTVRQRNRSLAKILFEVLPPLQREYLEALVTPPRETSPEIEIEIEIASVEGVAKTAKKREERRSHPRVAADLSVRFHPADVPWCRREGRTRDMSLDGMFIVADAPMPLGTRLCVELCDQKDPRVEPVVMEGEIVRCVVVAPLYPGTSGLGVRVLDGSDYQELVSTVAQRRSRA